MRSTIRSYHAAGSLSLLLASVFTLSLEAFLAEAEAAFAVEAAFAEALEAEALEAEALEEGLVVPAANDPTGWRHTGHVVCGFTVVLANHRRMHAV
jgi:hypothetical protein